METVSASVYTSDESAFDRSVGPTTPDGSPLFSATMTDVSLEKRFPSLSDLQGAEESPLATARRVQLPDIRDPATAAGITVKNICFIGAGYVGAPTAAVIALKNPSLRVTVLDRDEFRIRRWNSEHLPISEPGLVSVVRVARDGLKDSPTERKFGAGTDEQAKYKAATVRQREPNLFFTTDSAKSISEADMIFIAVNTPTKVTGVGAGSATDMTALEGSVEAIATHARIGAILVEKSTVPCRTAQFIQEMLNHSRPGARFQVLSNPEFLSEGTAVKDLLHPDRALIGSLDTVAGRRAAAALVNVYAAWIPRSKILGTNVFSSELSKLVANAMLAQRISSINSISAICERTGADVHEIAKSIGLDPRIGPQFLKAGLGFGGSCFRKDIGSLVYLANSLNLPEVGEYWEQVQLMNELQRSRFAKKVIARLNGTLIGKKITLLGFAFKKNTGDTRESLAIDIIQILLEERPAEIAIYDPGCNPTSIQRELDLLSCTPAQQKALKIYTDPYQGCANSNAILIVTDWDKFKNTPPVNNSKQPPNTRVATFSNFNSSEQHKDDLPLADQYLPQPLCPKNCPDCNDTFSGINLDQDFEWARIAYHMKKPKWVFDGRGVVDVTEMERLGVRVDVLGRADGGLALF